jgi:alpha-L-fucosidase
MKSAERLMQLYERSVAHDATLIINVPPDKRGLFTDAEVTTLKASGELRETRYGNNRATNRHIRFVSYRLALALAEVGLYY